MEVIWRIELLGGLKAGRSGQEIERFRTQKAGGLLALLAYHPNQTHCRETLIEQLWPNTDVSRGRHLLSQALNTLRHRLEPPGIPAGCILIADIPTSG
ncbi:MAG TPA: winged helix-turn-helix domain-containing protein [Chthonomonadaceae bacterium]|nr:winged helix-turn-helix domain-containing protein [Chthonomonadaceae bacterium]